MWYNDKQVSVNVLSYSDILMLKKQSNSCTWQEKKSKDKVALKNLCYWCSSVTKILKGTMTITTSGTFFFLD